MALEMALAGAALTIELLVISGELWSRWAAIGGGLIILSLAVSVIGRGMAKRGRRKFT